jgi:hypothetical protein
MAYASWVNPNKVSGNGDDTVSWSASEHTGRNSRTTTATFAASGVTPDPVLTIIQSGKTEFGDISDTASVNKNGGTLTITGTSNSSKLTFSLTGQNGIGLVLPASYLANSVQTNNGAAIAGDPGAMQEYTFSITFTGIGENTSVSALVSQLTVTTDNGDTDTCTITQAAGDAYLTISPTTITIPAAGTPAQSVAVSSNTNWTIS